MVKLLKKHGWILKNIEGSHHKMIKEGFSTISVPIHGKKELKIGIERRILKESDLLRFWKNRKGE